MTWGAFCGTMEREPIYYINEYGKTGTISGAMFLIEAPEQNPGNGTPSPSGENRHQAQDKPIRELEKKTKTEGTKETLKSTLAGGTEYTIIEGWHKTLDK